MSVVDGFLISYNDADKGTEIARQNIHNCEFFDTVQSIGRSCSLLIRVEGNRDLRLSTDDLRSIDDLKLELERFGGTFRGAETRRSEPVESELEPIGVADWSVDQCCQWLGLIGCPQLEGKFRENGVTGAVMLAMDLSSFQQTLELDDARELAVSVFDEIRDMKFNGNRFLKKRSVVRKKFRRFNGYSDENFEETNPLVDALCDPVKIKHRFLSTAERYFEKGVAASSSLRESGSVGSGAMPAPTVTDGRPEPFNTTRLRIKLVVTESMMNSRNLRLRKATSPFASAAGQAGGGSEFQYFRTAVIVGPWYLEWTDSELIVPKRMVSGRAVITADVDTLFVKREGLRDISDKIAEVVARWNTKYKYSSQGQGKGGGGRMDAESYSGNCQDFVDEVLGVLDVRPSFDGALGDFIQKMRSEGRADLQYVPCPAFVTYFTDTKPGVLNAEELGGCNFGTHQQLDAFCAKVAENCFDINELFASDWLLLKSFDRAFWMRHLQDRDDEKYLPMPPKRMDMSEFPTGCPFKDPRETISIMV